MEKILGNSVLDKYFGEDTMSVHFKEQCSFMQKNGKPGERKSVRSKEIISKVELESLIQEIYHELENRTDGFLEIDKPLSKVIQLGPFRIVIVYAPLSDGLEMTVVKPVKKLTLADYELGDKVLDLLGNQAQGILICSSPGSGKTTFAQALIEWLASKDKVIKTIESPRDLMVPDEIVQYSFSYASHSEIRDILLLSRPDYTVYDEVRNTEDFMLYKDLRLTGIGLVGVVHATKPVDGIQRFLGVIDLGIIPQIIDTVLYIQAGKIAQILRLKLTAKLPEGMESSDLTRPVIQISDFNTEELLYEIYTFGEQIVVMPIGGEDGIKKGSKKGGVEFFAQQFIHQHLSELWNFDFLVAVENAKSLKIFIPAGEKGAVIGKGGESIRNLEKELQMNISVRTFDELPSKKITNEMIERVSKNQLVIHFGSNYKLRPVTIMSDDHVFTFQTDGAGSVSVYQKQIIKLLSTRPSVVVDEGAI